MDNQGSTVFKAYLNTFTENAKENGLKRKQSRFLAQNSHTKVINHSLS